MVTSEFRKNEAQHGTGQDLWLKMKADMPRIIMRIAELKAAQGPLDVLAGHARMAEQEAVYVAHSSAEHGAYVSSGGASTAECR